MKQTWHQLSMDDLYELLVDKESSVFTKPKFPTKRWGKIYTKNATNDKLAIDRGLSELKKKGIICRKRLCKETMQKHPNQGKFYKIETKIL